MWERNHLPRLLTLGCSHLPRLLTPSWESGELQSAYASPWENCPAPEHQPQGPWDSELERQEVRLFIPPSETFPAPENTPKGPYLRAQWKSSGLSGHPENLCELSSTRSPTFETQGAQKTRTQSFSCRPGRPDNWLKLQSSYLDNFFGDSSIHQSAMNQVSITIILSYIPLSNSSSQSPSSHTSPNHHSYPISHHHHHHYGSQS